MHKLTMHKLSCLLATDKTAAQQSYVMAMNREFAELRSCCGVGGELGRGTVVTTYEQS